MLSSFYRRYSTHLLWLVGLSFPYLLVTAESLPSNNDIETWLPMESEVRVTYDSFKRKFGAEEVVLIGLEADQHAPELIDAVCARLEALPTVRCCWSPDRMSEAMSELGVSEDEIHKRLRGLSISRDGEMIGLVALLSGNGLADRATCVAQVRHVLEYCQLEGDATHLAGAPVVVAELDRLGNRENNKRFFMITLLVCLCLLYYSLREWKLTLAVLGLTVWAINLTIASLSWIGYEMNFILGALSVMVMVFTLAIVVHFLHYFSDSSEDPNPLGRALQLAWKPCCLATLTTVIGLLSLTVSEIGPVVQFGVAASIGCTVALLTGLGLTPALLTVLAPKNRRLVRSNGWFSRLGHWLLDRSGTVSIATMTFVLAACLGLPQLYSKIDPLDFLPGNSKVLNDVHRIQDDLTSTESVEAVVDFGREDLPFSSKLERVRELESKIAQDPAVTHTMSLATFFPRELPEGALELTSLLNKAKARQGDNDFVTANQRFWRISARISTPETRTKREVFDGLVASTSGAPIRFTGIAPLLEGAQREIFLGFWESFGTAFLIITGVMVFSLWSWKAGMIAMIPNLTPICIVFGILGWLQISVDIGMMMSGSIALGIAVDGTFHFLVRYQNQYKIDRDSPAAARAALLKTGPPILQAAVIAALGMLALTLSSFGPTARFGYLMATMLMAALIGDLVLLPCLLSLRPSRRLAARLEPHFRPGRRNARRRIRQMSRRAKIER